jgi:hypothetical protein
MSCEISKLAPCSAVFRPVRQSAVQPPVASGQRDPKDLLNTREFRGLDASAGPLRREEVYLTEVGTFVLNDASNKGPRTPNRHRARSRKPKERVRNKQARHKMSNVKPQRSITVGIRPIRKEGQNYRTAVPDKRVSVNLVVRTSGIRTSRIVNYNPRNIRRDTWNYAVTTDTVSA